VIFTYNITVNSEMNELSLKPRGWRFQDRQGLEEGAVGRISGVLELRLLCSFSRCVPLAAAGMKNNATQQAQLLPIRSRIEEKARKGRERGG
jgi:hypothetical protein